MTNHQAERSITAYIALGSNLGDSMRILTAAMDRLQELSIAPLIRSSFWRSAPQDCPPGSPDFLNAVVAMAPSPGETPASLLDQMQAIERQFGRRPKQVLNEPRPLDLDMLTFGGIVSGDPQLTLPHPRAATRSFVLTPWAEIAPEFVVPGIGRTVAELLAALPKDSELRLVRSAMN